MARSDGSGTGDSPGEQPVYITIKEAARLFEVRVTVAVVSKWMRTGVVDMKSPSHMREYIKLQCLRQGGSVYTTEKWVSEFKLRCSANVKGN